MGDARTTDHGTQKPSGFVEVLAQTSSPVEVGEIELTEEGVLRPREPDQPLSFSFIYNGIKFHADVPHDPSQAIHLTATLGVLPYSMENAFGRRAAKAIVARAQLPNGRLRIGEQLRVMIELAATPPRPRTPVSVLSTVTALLMEAKPYLDLLDVALRRRRRLPGFAGPRPAKASSAA